VTEWDLSQRLVDAGGLSDNLQIGVALDQLAQRAAHDSVVIDEKYTKYSCHEASPPPFFVRSDRCDTTS